MKMTKFPSSLSNTNDPSSLKRSKQKLNETWAKLKFELKTLVTFHPKEWASAFLSNPRYPLFCRSDLDGFVALFVDNMASLLAIIINLQVIFDSDIIYGKIVPGVALAMIWGNFYYVYMARKLAYKEKRDDVCSMPYGINTPGAFAFVFGIIFPAYYNCMKDKDEADKRTCQELAWHISIASNFITGVIILVLCVVGEFIRRKTPAVALLSSLSAVGFTYLALNQYVSIAEHPIVSFVPFAIVMSGYLGDVKTGPVPIALVALLIGTGLGWATSLNKAELVKTAAYSVRPNAPVFPVKDLFSSISLIGPYLSTTIPTAISIAIGTIQCVESAKRSGDFYPTRESMFADGVGTVIASLFGSFLGMTVYIGHPAYKRMGARQAYSIINALVLVPLCIFGVIGLLLNVIAVVAVNPTIIFIGLFICSETLVVTPQRHYPAFLIGIMPTIADWARSTIVSGVSTAYRQFTVPGVDFEVNVTSQINGFSYQGLSNFAGGSLLQCIFLTAIIMYMIDRKFTRAMIWSALASLLSFFGLIHSSTVGILYKSTDNGWKFSVAYGMICLLFGIFEIAQRLRWIKQPETEPDDLSSDEWKRWKEQKDATESSNSIVTRL